MSGRIRRSRWLVNPYSELFRSRPFARFWTGFTISALGDAMTRVALVWFVYQATKSPEAVGILLLCYTGPVLIGGLLAGYLLDRFDRGRVMLLDNLIRGLAVALIPLLYALGMLALWQLYVVASVYGFLYMITLAGTPTLIPSLARDEQLSAANALETLSYTVSGVLGPPIAGLPIAWVGAPGVLLLDAASYAIFVVARLELQHHPERQLQPVLGGVDCRGAVLLLLHLLGAPTGQFWHGQLLEQHGQWGIHRQLWQLGLG
jgi:MFS family permease